MTTSPNKQTNKKNKSATGVINHQDYGVKAENQEGAAARDSSFWPQRLDGGSNSEDREQDAELPSQQPVLILSPPGSAESFLVDGYLPPRSRPICELKISSRKTPGNSEWCQVTSRGLNSSCMTFSPAPPILSSSPPKMIQDNHAK